MAGTQVIQKRSAEVVSGTLKYAITTTCTIRGTLQDTNIFLLDINDTEDPKDDTFSRIVTVADINTYLIDRDDAIAAGATQWRSASTTLTYTDIETANAAWKEMNSRINTLVNTYDAYLTEYNTFDSGALILFPTTDESAKDTLIAAFETANTALTTAETARDAGIEDCEALESDLDVIEERLQEAQADLALYTAVQVALNTIYTIDVSAYATLLANNTSVRSNNSTSSASTTEQATIEALLVSNDALLSQYNTQNAAESSLLTTEVGQAVGILNARVNTLIQAKNSKFNELNKCRTEEAKLQAAVNSARTTRESALASVVAVCPDYVP